MRTFLAVLLVIGCDASTSAPAKTTDAKSEKKTETKVDAKTETKTDVKAETKTDAKAETKADAKAETKVDAPPGLKWTIETEPKSVKLADMGKLRVRITVTNGGTTVAAPIREARSFTVDGEASQALTLAFGNGGKAKVWSELPPGESVHDDREGVAFANTAGDHTIAMTDGAGNELARTVLHIDP